MTAPVPTSPTEGEPDRRRLILHQDDAVIVVDKPAALVVHPAPGHRGETLVDLLKGAAAGGPSERPGIVHRLDRDTSGLLVVAANEDAHRELSRQVREREVGRRYVALVEGRVGSRSGTIDAPVGRDHRARERMTVGGRRPREARTHFEVVELLPQDTLVDVSLETGRTHQIRTHFAAIGHPVAGDPRYGHAKRHGLGRQFLHASGLSFRHPVTGAEMSFTSELPPDLAEALERARS
ncbi:MAG TPA: RluA family pseudouridine synthase [Solirubrobacterales bacterium]|nr:RluA family pseudouridine synthase [Solirubrobacterales bacterium]